MLFILRTSVVMNIGETFHGFKIHKAALLLFYIDHGYLKKIISQRLKISAKGTAAYNIKKRLYIAEFRSKNYEKNE